MSGLKEIWCEQYRPKKLEDYIFQNKQQQLTVLNFVKDRSIPHLLLSGTQGSGKTSLAFVLLQELDCDPTDVLIINASDENNVDTIRDKIKQFVTTFSFNDFKVVLLEECLHEETQVLVYDMQLHQHRFVPIRDVNALTDTLVTYNIDTGEQELSSSFKLIDKGEQEMYEIELENGGTVKCTGTHKWFVEDENGETIVVPTTELHKYEHILSPECPHKNIQQYNKMISQVQKYTDE